VAQCVCCAIFRELPWPGLFRMAEAACASPQRSPTQADPSGSPCASPTSDALLTEVHALKVVLDDGASSESALLEALGSLQAHGTLPTKILGTSLIGKSVNILAKTSKTESVRDAALKLVSAWKENHRKRKASFSIDRTSSMDSGISLESSPVSSMSRMMSTDSLDVPCAPAPEDDKDKMTPRREKIREKIVEALGAVAELEVKDGSANDGVDLKDSTELAAEIETALHEGLSDKDYISQARAVLFNLKDKKNQLFRFKLQVGAIQPSAVPKLTASDMASEAKNAERKKQREDAMAAIDQDWAMKNGQIRISGLFTCGKCKGTQTTYFQMQTRSSDEPMTTFASCLQCGNRWKFC